MMTATSPQLYSTSLAPCTLAHHKTPVWLSDWPVDDTLRGIAGV